MRMLRTLLVLAKGVLLAVLVANFILIVFWVDAGVAIEAPVLALNAAAALMITPIPGNQFIDTLGRSTSAFSGLMAAGYWFFDEAASAEISLLVALVALFAAIVGTVGAFAWAVAPWLRIWMSESENRGKVRYWPANPVR